MQMHRFKCVVSKKYRSINTSDSFVRKLQTELQKLKLQKTKFANSFLFLTPWANRPCKYNTDIIPPYEVVKTHTIRPSFCLGLEKMFDFSYFPYSSYFCKRSVLVWTKTASKKRVISEIR